jgi:hypothetical protein
MTVATTSTHLNITVAMPTEFAFFSRAAFDQLVADFLKSRKAGHRRKAIITQDDYDLIVNILKEPEDTSTGTANDRFWAKNRFYLRDIGTSQNPILQVMTRNEDHIVCPFEKLYDVIGKIHGDVQKHSGGKKTFQMVRSEEKSVMFIIYICKIPSTNLS